MNLKSFVISINSLSFKRANLFFVFFLKSLDAVNSSTCFWHWWIILQPHCRLWNIWIFFRTKNSAPLKSYLIHYLREISSMRSFATRSLHTCITLQHQQSLCRNVWRWFVLSHEFTSTKIISEKWPKFWHCVCLQNVCFMLTYFVSLCPTSNYIAGTRVFVVISENLICISKEKC